MTTNHKESVMSKEEFAAGFTVAVNLEGVSFAPDTVFRQVRGWDSLCSLLAIEFVDETFGQQLSGRQIASATTVADLWEMVSAPRG